MTIDSAKPIDFDSIADLYDIYVRTDFDIPFWLREAKSVAGKVLELACGTGRVSLPLLRAGVDLACVDYAPGMLNRLRRKLEESGLSCPVYCQDIAELNLPALFDLIFIPFHSFSEIVDGGRQRLALQRIRAHLAPGGRLICTLQNPAVRTSTMDGTFRPIGEFSEEGQKLVVSGRLTFDPATHIASGEQVYEQLSPEGVICDRRVLRVNFRLFEKNDFESLVKETGFSIEALYGDYDRHSFEAAASQFMIWDLKRNTPCVKNLNAS